MVLSIISQRKIKFKNEKDMKIENINRFFNCSKFAIAGVSRGKKKFGNIIYKELKNKAYNVVPVNPNMDTFEGDICYRSIKELPTDIEAIIIATKPEVSYAIVKEAVEKGIKHIFMQRGAQNDDAIKYAQENNVNIIYKHCILMFTNPSGIHKFHTSLVKLFGLYPN
jgi:uncharacterized protein